MMLIKPNSTMCMLTVNTIIGAWGNRGSEVRHKRRREKKLLEPKAENKQWFPIRQQLCSSMHDAFTYVALMGVCVLTGVKSLSCLGTGTISLYDFEYLSILL